MNRSYLLLTGLVSTLAASDTPPAGTSTNPAGLGIAQPGLNANARAFQTQALSVPSAVSSRVQHTYATPIPRQVMPANNGPVLFYPGDSAFPFYPRQVIRYDHLLAQSNFQLQAAAAHPATYVPQYQGSFAAYAFPVSVGVGHGQCNSLHNPQFPAAAAAAYAPPATYGSQPLRDAAAPAAYAPLVTVRVGHGQYHSLHNPQFPAAPPAYAPPTYGSQKKRTQARICNENIRLFDSFLDDQSARRYDYPSADELAAIPKLEEKPSAALVGAEDKETHEAKRVNLQTQMTTVVLGLLPRGFSGIAKRSAGKNEQALDRSEERALCAIVNKLLGKGQNITALSLTFKEVTTFITFHLNSTYLEKFDELGCRILLDATGFWVLNTTSEIEIWTIVREAKDRFEQVHGKKIEYADTGLLAQRETNKDTSKEDRKKRKLYDDRSERYEMLERYKIFSK